MYAREIFLPAETFIVGKIHKHAHLNIVTRGRCTVVTEFGRLEIDATNGPVTFTSDAGAKRALYVHENTVWTTIHAVESTDLAEIEREIIAPGYPELDAFMARECERLISAQRCEGRVSLSPGSQSPQEPQPSSAAGASYPEAKSSLTPPSVAATFSCRCSIVSTSSSSRSFSPDTAPCRASTRC
jgi:hypothetical protein